MLRNSYLFGLLGILMIGNIFLISTGEKENTQNKEVGNPKLNLLMKETIDSCWFESFGNPDNYTFSGVGNVCDNAIHFITKLCQDTQLSGCKDPYLRKYLEAMGHNLEMEMQ